MSEVLVLNTDAQPLSMVPFSVITWQTAIRLAYQEKVRVVHEYEHWQVRSPSVTMKVPSVVMTSKYVKWNRMVKFSRTNILLRDNYTCQYCNNSSLPAHELTMDHVLPRSHGGRTNWTNIVTACHPCNRRKGNNPNVKPKIMPERPSYYDLIKKRTGFPILIRSQDWLNYVVWPEHMIEFKPPKRSIPK